MNNSGKNADSDGWGIPENPPPEGYYTLLDIQQLLGYDWTKALSFLEYFFDYEFRSREYFSASDMALVRRVFDLVGEGNTYAECYEILASKGELSAKLGMQTTGNEKGP